MNVLEMTPAKAIAAKSNVRVGLVRSDDADAKQVVGVLGTVPGVSIVQPKLNDLLRAGQDVPHYDVLLLEVDQFEEREIEAFTSIKNSVRDVPIIVVSEALPDQQLRTLMKLQPADWLKTPLSAMELKSAIGAAVKSSRANQNLVHAVIPASGGAGATTIAVAMADILAHRLRKTNNTVGLVDLDFSQGNCALYCNISGELNLQSVISNPTRIDPQFVQLIQKKHDNGFFAYSGKRRDIVNNENVFELVLRLLDAVSTQHFHTILDLPVHETDWRNDVFHTVNTATVVCEPNLPSIKQCLDVLEILKSRKDALGAVRVIVNKRVTGFFSPQRINKKQIQELLGSVEVLYLPFEPATTNEAINRGQMLSAANPSSSMVKVLTKYVEQVIAPKEAKK
ncbi:AAA family ATPase [Thioclava sp. FR2]|uniref:AAA family ATPase n=1 Tax=Thioclava sp. FR2 TaxID=3445780 RepID=UPI003EB72B39